MPLPTSSRLHWSTSRRALLSTVAGPLGGSQPRLGGHGSSSRVRRPGGRPEAGESRHRLHEDRPRRDERGAAPRDDWASTRDPMTRWPRRAQSRRSLSCWRWWPLLLASGSPRSTPSASTPSGGVTSWNRAWSSLRPRFGRPSHPGRGPNCWGCTPSRRLSSRPTAPWPRPTGEAPCRRRTRRAGANHAADPLDQGDRVQYHRGNMPSPCAHGPSRRCARRSQ